MKLSMTVCDSCLVAFAKRLSISYWCLNTANMGIRFRQRALNKKKRHQPKCRDLYESYKQESAETGSDANNNYKWLAEASRK